ncbi:phage tail assembly chaperone [Rhodobacteraceae bacterium]|nr:phage tail assembly chaperone [Paracoccaceae bacterium]
MNVYQTDIDGIFVGTTTADQDPLDSTNWLIPAGCVETAPPTITDKQLAKWDGADWVVQDTPVVELDPEPEPLSEAETVRAKRDALLAASDHMALADRITDEWRTYRRSLRDVPAQDGFPNTVSWPDIPS